MALQFVSEEKRTEEIYLELLRKKKSFFRDIPLEKKSPHIISK